MSRDIGLAPDSALMPEDFAALSSWLGTHPRLTQGALVGQFESVFADWLGRKHAIYVNSGSSANLLAVYALLESGRLKRGDEVAVPALSWATDVAPLVQFCLKPVLVDADINTLAMHPDGLRGTRAAVLVSVLGLVPDMSAYDSPALIEDCCESLGSRWNGQKLGTFGLMSTFSFFFGHHITTIEGGMVTTDDDGLAATLRQLRAHGWDRDTGGAPGSFNFVVPGFNVRNTEIGAFLGLRQMRRLDDIVAQRHAIFMAYQRALGKPTPAGSYVSAMAYPHIGRRQEIQARLDALHVESRVLIAGNIARHPFWFERYGRCTLPTADMIHETGFYVPCHQDMSEDDVRRIAEVMK